MLELNSNVSWAYQRERERERERENLKIYNINNLILMYSYYRNFFQIISMIY